MQAKTAKFPIKWELTGFGKLNIQKNLPHFVHLYIATIISWRFFMASFYNLLFKSSISMARTGDEPLFSLRFV